MKQLFTLKTLLFALMCVMGVGSSWAEEKSYTISFKDNGTTTDGSGTWSTSSKVTDVVTSGDYVSGITAAANVYPAREGRGAKFGTSSKAGSITFSLTKDGQVTAKRIEITGGAYIAKDKAEVAKIKVNGGTAIQFNQTVTTYTEETITYTYSTPTDITSISLVQNTASSGRFFVKSITVYYDEVDGSLTTPSWTLSPTSAVVNKGSSTTLDLTTDYDGTLSFTSNNTDVATVSYNAETKKIIVNGVAAGSTTISVTGAATSTYSAISKTIDVTVNQVELSHNKTVTSSDWGYAFFGLTPTGTNTYVQPDVETTEKNIDIFNVAIKRNGSDYSKPRYDASYLRLYKGNSIVITAPHGYNITSVTFTEPASGKGWSGTMTVTTGVYDNNAKKWFAEANDVNSIEITGSENTNRIGGIIVNLNSDGTTYELTIPSAGYATFYDSEHAYTMPEGCSGNIVKLVDGKLDLDYTDYKAEEDIPAGEPLLIQGDPGVYTLVYTTSAKTPKAENLLKGTDTETTITPDANSLFYGLSLNSSNDPSSIGFYWRAADGAAFTNGAHKAYLKLPKSSTAKTSFVFNADATGISSIDNGQLTIENGKFIENGRIVIKKNGNKFNTAGQLIK